MEPQGPPPSPRLSQQEGEPLAPHGTPPPACSGCRLWLAAMQEVAWTPVQWPFVLLPHPRRPQTSPGWGPRDWVPQANSAISHQCGGLLPCLLCQSFPRGDQPGPPIPFLLPWPHCTQQQATLDPLSGWHWFPRDPEPRAAAATSLVCCVEQPSWPAKPHGSSLPASRTCQCTPHPLTSLMGGLHRKGLSEARSLPRGDLSRRQS